MVQGRDLRSRAQIPAAVEKTRGKTQKLDVADSESQSKKRKRVQTSSKASQTSEALDAAEDSESSELTKRPIKRVAVTKAKDKDLIQRYDSDTLVLLV